MKYSAVDYKVPPLLLDKVSLRGKMDMTVGQAVVVFSLKNLVDSLKLVSISDIYIKLIFANIAIIPQGSGVEVVGPPIKKKKF